MPVPSPDALQVMRLLGHLMTIHGRAAQGVALLRAVDTLQPGDRSTRRVLVQACLAAGQPAEALGVIQLLREAGDAPALTALLRGQALHRLGRLDEAHQAYRTFLRLKATEPERAAP